MFVDHEKYRAFDVERHSTTCVCGNVADSFEIGYCSECTEKKEKYINNVVGTIELDDEVANLVVDPLETLRVKSTSDRISFLIDSYIKPNDIVVDATIGNGNDTLYLANKVTNENIWKKLEKWVKNEEIFVLNVKKWNMCNFIFRLI